MVGLFQIGNPLDWWRANRARFPNLAKLAMIELGVVIASAEVERMFCHSTNIVSAKRSCLSDGLAEALVLLKCTRNRKMFERSLVQHDTIDLVSKGGKKRLAATLSLLSSSSSSFSSSSSSSLSLSSSAKRKKAKNGEAQNEEEEEDLLEALEDIDASDFEDFVEVSQSDFSDSDENE